MTASRSPLASRLLTPEACALLDDLARRFGPRIQALLAARAERQGRFDAGELPDFPVETREVREAEWTVAPPPAALLDRRVEITGPVEPKMIVNALNSGARVFMADFEDSLAPTWSAVLTGHAALGEAVRGTLSVVTPKKTYVLRPDHAALLVRPRGLHLVEKHHLVDGAPIPASLFDFGLYTFHSALAAVERGAGPWFYLPKLESRHEARLWADVFAHTEAALGLSRGTIRATVLIETLPAAFEMDEVLWELREWSIGLNCGRWDYIFSAIKTLRAHPGRVFPDRGQLTMGEGFLDAYTRRLVEVCHRRGAHAMGGMAAQVPGGSPEADEAIFASIRADKLAEVRKGFDGTWVAHPALVPVARAVFDAHVEGPNQLDVRPAVVPGRDALLAAPVGTRTEAGLRTNLRVGVRYLASWLSGVGCVAIDGRMEDAATAEICRAQIWQWLRWGARLDDVPPGPGSVVTAERVAALLAEEVAALRGVPRVGEAAALFASLYAGDPLADFLTVPAYDLLCKESA